jgi:hypothetical protein
MLIFFEGKFLEIQAGAEGQLVSIHNVASTVLNKFHTSTY